MRTSRCLTIADLASNFRGMPRDAPLIIKLGDQQFCLCGTSAGYLRGAPGELGGPNAVSDRGVYSILLLAGEQVEGGS
jgi:hypothetical protein